MVDGSKTELGITTPETLSKKPTSVLIIDDSVPLLNNIKREVRANGGFDVETAADPFGGLEMIRKAYDEGRPIGVVICDLNMPGMNGEELAQKAKGLSGYFILHSLEVEKPEIMTPEQAAITGVDAKFPKDGSSITEFMDRIGAAKKEVKSEDEIKKEAEKKDLLRILIAEDSKDSDVLKEMVDEHTTGFEVKNLTGSVSEALKMLRDAKEQGKPIDVIISDLSLIDDKEGGFKIAQAVRDEGLAEYFILFTGKAIDVEEKYTKEQLKRMGIDQVLGKPLRKDTLRMSLNLAKEEIKLARKNKTETAPKP